MCSFAVLYGFEIAYDGARTSVCPAGLNYTCKRVLRSRMFLLANLFLFVSNKIGGGEMVFSDFERKVGGSNN